MTDTPKVISTSDALARHIENCAAELGLSPSTFCLRALGYPGLMPNLQRREERLKRYRREVDAFMETQRADQGGSTNG